MQISWLEGRKYTEKVRFERKKEASKQKAAKNKWIYPITLVEYNPFKKLEKKLVKLEKRYEQAVLKKHVLAKRILKSALSVAQKIKVQRETLVKV